MSWLPLSDSYRNLVCMHMWLYFLEHKILIFLIWLIHDGVWQHLIKKKWTFTCQWNENVNQSCQANKWYSLSLILGWVPLEIYTEQIQKSFQLSKQEWSSAHIADESSMTGFYFCRIVRFTTKFSDSELLHVNFSLCTVCQVLNIFEQQC